jgi:hypothetical protein
VSAVSGAHRCAERSRYSFRSDAHAAQREIDKFARRELTILGEWPTHSEKIPRPSKSELAATQGIVERSWLNTSTLVLLIVGLAESNADLGVWHFRHVACASFTDVIKRWGGGPTAPCGRRRSGVCNSSSRPNLAPSIQKLNFLRIRVVWTCRAVAAPPQNMLETRMRKTIHDLPGALFQIGQDAPTGTQPLFHLRYHVPELPAELFLTKRETAARSRSARSTCHAHKLRTVPAIEQTRTRTIPPQRTM